ncbi:MAG: hypothetical protein JWM14_585 [Chitinophagaceae bacterium]|nr:hypothetical protein [Chitinophagaceae bacterium]
MQLFQLIQKPVYQALLFVLLTLVLAWIVKPKTADKIWVIGGLMYCFFILTNFVLSFWAIDTWSYFFISLGFSLLYLAVIVLVVKVLMKMLKLEGSEESAMIFLVIIFHPFFLLLAIFFKWGFLKMF